MIRNMTLKIDFYLKSVDNKSRNFRIIKTREGDSMATILQVAKYILQKNGPTTTMKLQKLAYYCQAWSLVWEEKPLFNEDFYAWANGPVSTTLFHKHKGEFEATLDDYNDVEDGNFNQDQIETMDSVIKYYGKRSPVWLSELTHKERPWLDARGDTPPGEPCHKKIKKEAMQAYYSSLK